MMYNEELKKKIVEVLKKAMEPIEYGGDSEHAPEVHYPTEEEIADAIIAAVIGYVKDLQAQVNALEMTNIALQAGYDGAEKDRLYWVDKYKEAEHRADKAKKDCDAYKIALRKALKTDNCAECFSTISVDNECFTQWGCDRGNEKCINTLFKQAEKELLEERKKL